MPAGCSFHPRCDHALERCGREEPQLLAPAGFGQDRTVACWLQTGDVPPPEPLALPEPGQRHIVDLTVGEAS